MYDRNCECNGLGMIYLCEGLSQPCDCFMKKVGKWKMPFGKHKGKEFCNIEKNYLIWIYNNTDLFKDSEKYKYNKWIRQYLAHIAEDIKTSEFY